MDKQNKNKILKNTEKKKIKKTVMIIDDTHFEFENIWFFLNKKSKKKEIKVNEKRRIYFKRVSFKTLTNKWITQNP